MKLWEIKIWRKLKKKIRSEEKKKRKGRRITENVTNFKKDLGMNSEEEKQNKRLREEIEIRENVTREKNEKREEDAKK